MSATSRWPWSRPTAYRDGWRPTPAGEAVRGDAGTQVRVRNECHEIVEFDYFTGREMLVPAYPTPAEPWSRDRVGTGLTDDVGQRLLTPMNHSIRKGERYYQETAVNRAVEGILKGRHRQLVAELH